MNIPELKKAMRELKCLISLNGVTPRTEYKSLLNKNLDDRKEALEIILSACQLLCDAIEKGKIDVDKL